VFKGTLSIADLALVEANDHKPNAFANLAALELVSVFPALLSRLDTLGQLPLRYLCLGDAFQKIKRRSHPHIPSINEGKNALHRLLHKLNHLEVLVSLWNIDLDVTAIKIMTRKQRNPRSALLRYHIKCLDQEEGPESFDGRDNSDDQVELVAFADMLLEKNPSIDLAAFEFVVNNARSKTFLQDARTGFSIYRATDKHHEALDKWSLSHPLVRRQLGLDF